MSQQQQQTSGGSNGESHQQQLQQQLGASNGGGGEQATMAVTTTTTDPALKVMCDEYGKYLDFPELSKTQIQSIDDAVENMLARLDEFAAFVEVVRQDSVKSMKLFPQLKERCKQIEKTFPVIDALENMVNAVKGNLESLEERANAADKVISALNAEYSTTFKWFVKVTNTPTANLAETKWEPIKLTTADEFVSTIRNAKDAPPPSPQSPSPSHPTPTPTPTSQVSTASTSTPTTPTPTPPSQTTTSAPETVSTSE